MEVLQTDNFGNQKEVEINPVAESNKQKKDWEKEFDEKFTKPFDRGIMLKDCGERCMTDPEDIKNFISQVEQSAYERGREEGQGWNNPCKQCGYNNH